MTHPTSQPAGGPSARAGRTIRRALLWAFGILAGLLVLLILAGALVDPSPPSLAYTQVAVGSGTPHPAVVLHANIPPRGSIQIGEQIAQADENGNVQLTFAASGLTPGENTFQAIVTNNRNKSGQFPVAIAKPEFPLYLNVITTGGELRGGVYHTKVQVETEPGAMVTAAGETATAGETAVTLLWPIDLSGEPTPVLVTATTRDERKAEVTVEPTQPEMLPVELQEETFQAPVFEKVATVRGHTLTGATIKINGQPVEVNDQGQFAHEVTTPKPGQYEVKLSAQWRAGNLQPVTVTRTITRKLPPIPLQASIVGPNPTTAKSVTIQIRTTKGATLYVDRQIQKGKVQKDEENYTYQFPDLFEGTATIEVKAEHPDYEAVTVTVRATRQLSPEEREAAARAAYIRGVNESLTTRHLTKNPERYRGEKVKIRGQIMQIGEEGNLTWMLVQTEYLGYDIWSDPLVMLTFDGLNNYLEDHVITAYGEVLGSFTYDTKIGGKNTVPHIHVRYWGK